MQDQYLNSAILKIMELQQQRNPNFVQSHDIGVGFNPSQTVEQIILGQLFDIRNLEVKGDYVCDNNGNEMPIIENVKGTFLTKEGYPFSFEKKRFYTMDDGTSQGEFAVCMNHGAVVHKDNLYQCPVCGKTCCVLCGKPSQSGQYYCCTWHKIIG